MRPLWMDFRSGIPRPLPRATKAQCLRRRRRFAACSPRSATETQYWATRDDLPEPAGPRTSVAVPRSSPLPSRSSRADTPLWTRSNSNVGLCSEATRRGGDPDTAGFDDVVVEAVAMSPRPKFADSRCGGASLRTRARGVRARRHRGTRLSNVLRRKTRRCDRRGAGPCSCCPRSGALRGEDPPAVAQRLMGRAAVSPTASRRRRGPAAPCSTSASSVRTAALSLISEGWHIVYWASVSCCASAAPSSKSESPSRDQPCERATSVSSSLRLGERDVEAHVPPAFAPASRNWSARVVFPTPGRPLSR